MILEMHPPHRAGHRAPGEADRLLYDAAAGVVRPRVGGGAMTAAWAIVFGLLAVALLGGALTHPTVPQPQSSRNTL